MLGLAGTVVSDASLRQTFWAIDGVGIIVATALLTTKFLRRGNDPPPDPSDAKQGPTPRDGRDRPLYRHKAFGRQPWRAVGAPIRKSVLRRRFRYLTAHKKTSLPFRSSPCAPW